MRHIVDFIDNSHRQGKGVTLRKVRTSVRKKFGLEISKTCASQTMKKLGLTYQPVKKRRRNQNAYRPERIREFLVGYDGIVKAKA